MHLEFAVTVDDVDPEGRTISGLGVPWNQAGKIGGRTYKFQRGSLSPAMRRTPLILGHDGEPVGVLQAHADDDDGARVTFRVDATPDGDRALVQAASGSRGALSVGADVDDATVQADGSVLVTAARYVHFALVPHGAFVGAEVEHVVAQRDTHTNETEGSTVIEDRIAAARETPTEPEPEPTEPTEPEPERSPRARVRAFAERRPELNAGAYAVLAIRAQRGDGDALRVLAALTETPITDLGGVLPPQYERTVLGEKTVDRVLWSIFAGRPLPAAGTQVIKPTWTTGPVGAWAGTLDADATTSAVVIGTTPATIERWDWAAALPWVAVQRSDPDLLDTIYAAAVLDFYGAVEKKIAALLASGTVSLADTLGAGIAAFYDATEKSPEIIVVAPDVWGAMADAKELDKPVGGGDGVSGVAGLSASFAGLTITASGALAVGERILATRRALDVRISDPVRLTANAIGALNVELGVVGEGLFDVDYASELVKLTPPVGTLAASSGRGSRSSN